MVSGPATFGAVQGVSQSIQVDGLRKGTGPSHNQSAAGCRAAARPGSGDNGLVDGSVASAISKVHGLRLYGVRTGIWLTSAGARELLGIPDSGSVRGKRDRAILAVLLGCGL